MPQIPEAAIQMALATVDVGWREAVSEQLATVLSRRLTKALARRSDSRALCRELSAIANGLDDVADAPKKIAVWTTKRLLALWDRPPLEQKIAGKIAAAVVEHVPAAAAWPSVKIQLTARCLRICGVWVCLDDALSLRGCPCFADLATDAAKEYVQRILEEKLDRIVA